MKTKYIVLIIIVILIIVAIVLRKKIKAFVSEFIAGANSTDSGISPRTSGSELTQEDLDCGNSGMTGKLLEACTRPRFQLSGAIQKSFKNSPEADADFDFDFCPEEITTHGYDGRKWYFNFQSGKNCIYVAEKKNPTNYNQ